MARIVQRSFASGELAPEFWGQQDQDFYRSGAKSLRNVVVTKEGALRKRSGLEHLAAVARRVIHALGALQQARRGLELAVGGEGHPEVIGRGVGMEIL